MKLFRVAALSFACCLSVTVLAQSPAAPLSIATDSLPAPLVHQSYHADLKASGGVPPLQWKISRGSLPGGLELDSSSGLISGTPTTPAEIVVTVSVVDSVGNTMSRDFKIKVVAPLLIQWAHFPRVQGDQILGAVKVSNGTKDRFDLTVVILAIDEHGKAFALGYQRFDLQPETTDIEIPFGESANLPFGGYVVHADAVAEIAAKDLIFRERQQTEAPLRITAQP